MSKRRDIEAHLQALGEIEGIMGAMKNLALMETHKLGRILPMQHRVVEEIETAGRDFLSFHATFTPEVSGHDIFLIIGAERGFCGDFNDRLLSALDRHLQLKNDRNPVLVVVGQKLVQRAERVNTIAAFVEGPTVADEVPVVLLRVIERVRDLSARHRGGERTAVTAVYRDAMTEEIVIRPVRPFESSSPPEEDHPFGPLLTLAPDRIFAQLVDLYLFSLLHEIFYNALMAESRARLAHLESALQRLGRDRADLVRRRNVLRQEEITEEIEVLMLNRYALPHLRQSTV